MTEPDIPANVIALPVARYTIRRSNNAGDVRYRRQVTWRVYLGRRPVSIPFATFAQALYCRMVLIADDRKHPRRTA